MHSQAMGHQAMGHEAAHIEDVIGKAREEHGKKA
jgi:hypothetical protein